MDIISTCINSMSYPKIKLKLFSEVQKCLICNTDMQEKCDFLII